ncbi:hypothetical protein BDE40_3219 [Litoreibacter halocynthiae]|uniref:Uncharacterized protein n=1 Tax=Litoreibacter halocynthiae TaxID=1242689 RepID=A0A4R7LBZ5_9RHOB|nr:hypothetical protein BDE40_3219 [Litoreibacter halocynthiae]
MVAPFRPSYPNAQAAVQKKRRNFSNVVTSL